MLLLQQYYSLTNNVSCEYTFCTFFIREYKNHSDKTAIYLMDKLQGLYIPHLFTLIQKCISLETFIFLHLLGSIWIRTMGHLKIDNISS